MTHPAQTLTMPKSDQDSEADALRAMASTAFRPDLDFDSKIRTFLELGCDKLGLQNGVLGRIDGDRFRVEHVFTTDLKVVPGFECPVEDTLCRETLVQESTLAIEYVGASRFRSRRAYLRFHAESFIGSIVRVNGRNYGTLAFVALSPRELPFTHADKEYVRLMALWVGSELERHNIVQELETRVEERSQLLRSIAERDRLLREIGIAIRTSLDPADIEAKATRLLGEALHADRCFFTHFEFERDSMRIGADWRRRELASISGEYKPSAYGMDIGGLFQSGASLVIDDVETGDWPDQTTRNRRSFRIRSIIDVPMFRDNHLEAVLCVAMETPRQWKDDEVSLAEAVAVQTRGAIEAASVLQRERRIATTLQEALLPPLPARLPGMELDYAYRAALDEAGVGGDFYAAYPIDRTRHALVIGDVSGKGLMAASNVAALQNILRYAIHASRTLSEAVTQMNAVIIEHGLLNGFATMLVSIYDSQSCVLTYCSCGHEPTLIFADDTVRQLETTGPPIGAAEGAVYQERSVQLAVGDVVIMYTDGLSEAGPDRRTLLGIEGLTEIARRRIREDEGTWTASEIILDAMNFSNGRLRDDACVIVARLTESVEVAPAVVDVAGPSITKDPLPATDRLRDTPAEEQFRLLVDNVSEYAIFLLDVNGYIVTWNRGAERLKGYSAPEIIGKHFSIFYTPDDLQRNHPLNELAIATDEGRYEEEGWRVRKDGTWFWANVVITALWDRHGRLCGFGKVTRDFTERRAADEARLQSMRDEISRSFLRDILYSVTEGRLRYCNDIGDLPDRLPRLISEGPLRRDSLTTMRVLLTEVAQSIGFSENRMADLITAASEAGMNAVVHATQAEYSIHVDQSTVQVRISDRGNGIELTKLHRATLERGFTTENSLGHGFWLMLHTCDRLWLNSNSSGTAIVLEQDREVPEPEWLSRAREVSDYVDTASAAVEQVSAA